MKRLALRVLLFLLTFSAGVAVQRILFAKNHVDAPQIVQSTEPMVTYVDVPVFVPAASPTPHLILDYDAKKYDHYGYYGILGNKPRQFQEIDSVGLEVYEAESGPTGTMSIGTVDGEDYDSQYAVFGLLTSRKVFFVTGPFKSGFEYRFDGVFLYEKVPDNWAGTNRAVIKGTITKSKNGRKVAEADILLRLEHFGC